MLEVLSKIYGQTQLLKAMLSQQFFMASILRKSIFQHNDINLQ